MRAILYPRISLEEGSQYGLPSQLRAMQEYAQAKGYHVVAELSEEFTGKTLDRPQLNQVREMARERQFDVLIAHSLDRLTRKMGQLAALRDELAKHAVSIEYVLTQSDDTIESRVMQQMLEAFADYEREKIHERTMRGRREKAKRGLIVGGRVPYGYLYDAGALRIVEEKAAVVRKIFGWVESGEAERAIARRLRREGVPTARGGYWTHTTVRKILVNETYCGQAYYGTHRREGTVIRIRPEGRIPIPAPPILLREQWERVQAMLKQRDPQTHGGRPSARYLLRGLLHCACGRRLCGSWSAKSLAWYRCTGRDLDDPGRVCSRGVRADRLDQAVWSEVSRAFSDARALRVLVAAHLEALQADGGQARAVQLRKQIGGLRGKEDRALSLMLEIAEAREALRKKYQALCEERRAAEAELARIEAAEQAAAGAGDAVEAIVAEVTGVLGQLDREERREFLCRAVERVTWDGQAAEIRCFFMAQNWKQRLNDGAGFHRFEFTLEARLAA